MGIHMEMLQCSKYGEEEETARHVLSTAQLNILSTVTELEDGEEGVGGQDDILGRVLGSSKARGLTDLGVL